MKDIETVLKYYPSYVHVYFTGLCEIDGCKKPIVDLFLMQSGAASPMCHAHGMEYRRKAKLIPASSALADKQWKIVTKKEETDFQPTNAAVMPG